ncbi:hypothetical protein B0J14DRAFT_98638 [Halenospora varia]|nr:hypothetical protein B0J14DRAFT_98638 [Halenospora varia]
MFAPPPPVRLNETLDPIQLRIDAALWIERLLIGFCACCCIGRRMHLSALSRAGQTSRQQRKLFHKAHCEAHSRRRPHLTVSSLPNSCSSTFHRTKTVSATNPHCVAHLFTLVACRQRPHFPVSESVGPSISIYSHDDELSRQQLALPTGPPPSSCLQLSSLSKPRHLLLATTTALLKENSTQTPRPRGLDLHQSRHPREPDRHRERCKVYALPSLSVPSRSRAFYRSLVNRASREHHPLTNQPYIKRWSELLQLPKALFSIGPP